MRRQANLFGIGNCRLANALGLARRFGFGFGADGRDFLIESAKARFDFGEPALGFFFVAPRLFKLFQDRRRAVIEDLADANLLDENVNQKGDKDQQVDDAPARVSPPDFVLWIFGEKQ